MSATLASVEHELAARPRRWLVTGAAGFIGSHLVERLLALGQDVVALDDLTSGTRSNLEAVAGAAHGPARLRFLQADVRDREALARALVGVEFVLHQAGLGSVPRSLADPGTSFDVNARGTWELLVAARAAGVRRVVCASSSSVYGDERASPQREERLGTPLSPYAAAKRAAELAAEGLARAGGPEVAALRYFNVFGPRQSPRGPYAAVSPRWGAALLAGQRPELFGDGSTSRDFTPVAGVVAANLLAATRALVEPFRAFNVGAGCATSLVDLHRLLVAVARALGRAAPSELVAAPARAGERPASLADLTRLRGELGYEPPALSPEFLQATLVGLARAVDSPRGGL
ncbi:MAG: NAD-dependent epimerase/dehydratase family protein [Planctomycetota bacterium]